VKLRLWLALTTCIVGVGLIPGIAAADRPTKTEISPVGDQIVCGETVLTISSGVVVTRTHVHELRSGLFRVIFVERPHHVRAMDEEETVYRVVGSSRASFTTPDPEAEGGEVGSFDFKLNIIGPGGLFGKVKFRLQFKRNGAVVERDRSTCELFA
jgi:hypothetical protein